MSRTFSYFYSTPLVDEKGDALSMIDVRREMREMQAVFEDSNAEREMKFVTAVATASKFAKVLSTKQPSVIHFSGHGDRDGYVVFEDELGGVRRIGVEEFSELLLRVGSGRKVDLMFLSCCYSEKLSRQLMKNKCANAIVAVNTDHAILDTVSIKFTSSFYAALFNGFKINEAFEIARARIKLDGGDYERNFVKLLASENDGNYAVTRRTRKKREVEEKETKRSQIVRVLNRCDCPPLNFVGRAKEIQRLVQMLSRVTSVACISAPGVGSTSVVLKVAQFVTERQIFDDVYFVNLDREEYPIRDAICRALKLSKYVTDSDMVNTFKERFKSERILLVIDGCDTYKRNIDSDLCRFLESSMGLHLLLSVRHNTTSTETTNHHHPRTPKIKMEESLAKRNLKLTRLSDESTALLFLRECSRNLTFSELRHLSEIELSDLKSFDDVVRAFSTSQLVRSLNGSARTAVRVAAYINSSTDLTNDEVVRKIVDTIVPSISKQVQKRDMSKELRNRVIKIMRLYIKEREELQRVVSEFILSIWRTNNGEVIMRWPDVSYHLVENFRVSFPEISSRRHLERKDLDALFSYSVSHPKSGPFRFSREKLFCLNTVADFYARWWIPFKLSMYALKSSWVARPYDIDGKPLGALIEGFLRNTDVVNLLRGCSVGTFLVRFSYSKPGWLSVEYLIEGKVAPQKRRAIIEVFYQVDGSPRFVLPIKKGFKFERSSLPELLNAVTLFKYLHPDRPKNRILSSKHHNRRRRHGGVDGKRGMAWGVVTSSS